MTPIRFISATQEFTDDAEGEFLESNIAVVNQYYSRIISKKVKLKRQLRADRGEWNGGRRPYGYTSTAGRLLVVEGEAANARRMFELFLEHPSAMSVRERLRDAQGHRRSGRPPVERLLRPSKPPAQPGLRGPGQDIARTAPTRQGIHEAIISSELWDRVQAAKTTRTRLVTKVERPFPLATLLVCGACDARMTSTTWPRRTAWRRPPGAIAARRRSSADGTSARSRRSTPTRSSSGPRTRSPSSAPRASCSTTRSPPPTPPTISGPSRYAASTRGLLARMIETRAKVARLVDAIAEGGAGFTSIRAKLTLEERNLRLLDHDLTRVKGEIDRLVGEPDRHRPAPPRAPGLRHPVRGRQRG